MQEMMLEISRARNIVTEEKMIPKKSKKSKRSRKLKKSKKSKNE